jgi:hypothetical protein
LTGARFQAKESYRESDHCVVVCVLVAWTYYIDGLLRQPSAQYARRYLGLEDDSGGLTCNYLVQNTPTWNDVRIPMASMRQGSAAPTLDDFVALATPIRAWKFKNGATEQLEFELQVPHGITDDAAYGVRLHIHWSCQSATGANKVGWYIAATYANIGEVFGPSVTYGPGTGATTTPYEHVVTPVHTLTGLKESAVIVGKIWRDPADTYAGNDVFGLSLDAHCASIQLGSIEEIPD